MKRYLFFLVICFLLKVNSTAQIGINTNNPKATLQIDALNSISPESSAGMGVPLLDNFPTQVPTVDKNAMLVYVKNSTSSSLKGFYFWDPVENNWEFIIDESAAGYDTSKIIVSGNAFFPNDISGSTGPQTRNIPFTTINSIDNSFNLLPDGSLQIGRTAKYYLSFSGGIFREIENAVYAFTCRILVNGISSNILSSNNSAPGGLAAGRAVTFYIGAIVQLQKGDIITTTTTKDSGGVTKVAVDSPYTLTLIKMD